MLATIATVIASQAVISGAFSVTRQAVQLGFLPRLTILHTSREAGQVYVPAVNWGIFVAVVALVVGFGSSAHLAAAYGIAVTGTLAIDTVLFFVVVHVLWKKPLWVAITSGGLFLLVDLTFFTANLPKILHGGWFPLVIAGLVFVVLTTWQRGREIVTKKREELEGPLSDFIEEIRDPKQPISRSPRTGIFLDANPETTPLALRANVEHNCVLHESVVIVSVQTLNVPHVDESERVTVDDLGYTRRRDHARDRALRLPGRPRRAGDAARAPPSGSSARPTSRTSPTSCRASRSSPPTRPGWRRWRKKLFIAIARNAASPVPYFHLPDDRTVVMASHVEL